MILGFTGTRRGMTAAQLAALPGVVAALPARALHGGAIGADEEWDAYLVRAKMLRCDIEVYPASAERAVYWTRRGNIVHPTAAPLSRNRLIVARAEHLLAAPAEMTEVTRSGTWATVRAARKAGRPITLLLPDGSVREERR